MNPTPTPFISPETVRQANENLIQAVWMWFWPIFQGIESATGIPAEIVAWVSGIALGIWMITALIYAVQGRSMRYLREDIVDWVSRFY